MTVKIAEGFVEVTARTDTTQTRRSADRAGRGAGGWFARAFGRGTERGMGREQRRLDTVFTKTGTNAGDMFSKGMRTGIFRGSRKTDAAAAASGVSAGRAFTRAYTLALDKAKAPMGFFQRIRRGASREGEASGAGFAGGMGRAVSRGMGGLVSTVGSGFAAVGKLPWVFVAIVAAAMLVLPALGATAGAALTLAFGAGLAGVGLLAAAQAEKVQEAFSDLKDHVVSTMKEIAAPLEDTLVDVADDLTSLFDNLAPHLEDAFADMAPVLSRFSEDLFGAFEGDGSLISGITDAFTALLEDLGPKLGPAFDRMGQALKDLFGTVEENPDVFSDIIIGALDLVTGLIKLVDWLSEAYVWIQDKIPGGLLTLISPMGGLTTELLANEEASGKLISKFKEMGEAFSEAGGFISESVDYVKEKLGPFIDDITEALANSDILDKVSEWWTEVSGIVSLAGELIGALMRRLADVFAFIWEHFGERIKGIFGGLWTVLSGMVSGGLEAIKGILNFFIGVLTGDWDRAWNGIKQTFSGIWTSLVGIVTGAWGVLSNLVMGIVEGIVGAFKWLYDILVGESIIPDMVNAIVGWFVGLRDRGAAVIGAARDWIVARFTAMRDWAVAVVVSMRDRALAYLTSLRDRATTRAQELKDWVTSKAVGLKDGVVSAFTTLKDKAIGAFTDAKDGIKEIWKEVKKAVKDPVKFAIDTVYNDGIVELWNNIAEKVPGIGTIDTMAIPAGFEQGGLVDMRRGGIQPGYSAKDNRLAMFRDGEAVLVPEAVRSLGAGFIHSANRMKGRANELLAGLPGFRFGGIIGDFKDSMSGFFKDGFMNAVREVTGPIVDSIRDEFGTNGFRGLPTKIVQALIGDLHDFWSPFSSDLEGGGGQGVVTEARKHIGKRGRPNEFTTPYMAGSWPWCGAFAGQMFERSGNGKAISSVAWKPAVRSWRSLSKTSDPRPGDVALYRGDDGHINIIEDPATGKTIGGNESDSVRRQTGYMRSASSYRRPAFAQGGVVEARRFWNQDRRETSDSLTPLRDRTMRDVFAGGLFDEGGMLPHGGVAVNMSGRPEPVLTSEQWRALSGAASSRGDIHIHGDIVIDAKNVKDFNDVVEVFDRLQVTARQHGARVRTGAPR